MFLLARVMYCIRPYSGPTDRGVKASSRRQNGCSVVPEHPHVGPHGQNRASLLMNPMYSIARTRQCPRKSFSPQRSSHTQLIQVVGIATAQTQRTLASFDEPDVLHSSYPAVSSRIMFTTTIYGCLHVERITACHFFYTYT